MYGSNYYLLKTLYGSFQSKFGSWEASFFVKSQVISVSDDIRPRAIASALTNPYQVGVVVSSLDLGFVSQFKSPLFICAIARQQGHSVGVSFRGHGLLEQQGNG